LKIQLTILISIFAFNITLANEQPPFGIESSKWFAPWERINAFAIINNKKYPIYRDPRFHTNLLVMDRKNCWIIRTDEKKVITAGCGIFKTKNNTVSLSAVNADIADVYWDDNGRIVGYAWEDIIFDCGSLFTILFRRPKFYKNRILFGGCDDQGMIEVFLRKKKE